MSAWGDENIQMGITVLGKQLGKESLAGQNHQGKRPERTESLAEQWSVGWQGLTEFT